MRPATESEQKYLDKAAYYFERARLCYVCELWPESLNNHGSTLESLLRIRFESGGTLFELVNKFDSDTFFNSVILHDGASRKCATCYADRIRIFRNSVHPDCWKVATQKDVDDSLLLILLVYHALVQCESQRIADFQEPQGSTLKTLMELCMTPSDTEATEGAS